MQHRYSTLQHPDGEFLCAVQTEFLISSQLRPAATIINILRGAESGYFGESLVIPGSTENAPRHNRFCGLLSFFR